MLHGHGENSNIRHAMTSYRFSTTVSSGILKNTYSTCSVAGVVEGYVYYNNAWTFPCIIYMNALPQSIQLIVFYRKAPKGSQYEATYSYR